MTDKQKAQVEKYIMRIDTATQTEASDLYFVWTELNAIYGSVIPSIGDLFEKAQQYSGVAKRNLIAARGVLENYIIESNTITNKPRLFVSYSRHDSDYIDGLVGEINKLGVEFFTTKNRLSGATTGRIKYGRALAGRILR
jgi:hypothetical protein